MSMGLWQQLIAGRGSCWAVGQTGAGSPLCCPGLVLSPVLEKGFVAWGRGFGVFGRGD